MKDKTMGFKERMALLPKIDYVPPPQPSITLPVELTKYGNSPYVKIKQRDDRWEVVVSFNSCDEKHNLCSMSIDAAQATSIVDRLDKLVRQIRAFESQE